MAKLAPGRRRPHYRTYKQGSSKWRTRTCLFCGKRVAGSRKVFFAHAKLVSILSDAYPQDHWRRWAKYCWHGPPGWQLETRVVRIGDKAS